MNFKENNYTVGCDIHDYIFTKANFLIKSVKIFMTRKFWYTFKKIFSNPSKLYHTCVWLSYCNFVAYIMYVHKIHLYLLKALPRVCTENTARGGMSRDKYSTRRSRALYLSRDMPPSAVFSYT